MSRGLNTNDEVLCPHNKISDECNRCRLKNVSYKRAISRPIKKLVLKQPQEPLFIKQVYIITNGKDFGGFDTVEEALKYANKKGLIITRVK